MLCYKENGFKSIRNYRKEDTIPKKGSSKFIKQNINTNQENNRNLGNIARKIIPNNLISMRSIPERQEFRQNQRSTSAGPKYKLR